VGEVFSKGRPPLIPPHHAQRAWGEGKFYSVLPAESGSPLRLNAPRQKFAAVAQTLLVNAVSNAGG
jgi:hypothetical protein